MPKKLRNVTNTIKKKQDILLQYLKETYGNITLSCEKLGITRQTYYRWIEEPEFKQQIDELEFEERNLDLAENQLRKLMLNGNVTAIIFYLKTKGKKRGYIEGALDVNIESKGLFKDIADLYQKGKEGV